jgi:hypothetical protein
MKFPATRVSRRMLAVMAFACLMPAGQAAPPESDAWRRALELATAFSNDGFRIRDGHWFGRLETGAGSKVLETNLYAGNAYWFCAATRNTQCMVTLSVHDASGAVLAMEPSLEEGRSAVAFAPEISGPYYLRISVLPKTGQASAIDSFCVVYSYK